MAMVDELAEKIELSSSRLLSEKQDTALAEFGRQLLHSGLGNPLSALAQPLDRSFNTDISGSIQKAFEPAAPAEFNSGRFWLQQSASAAGTMGSYLLAATVAKGLMRRGMSEQQLANHLAGRGALGLTMKEAALTGFLHDSILRPTQSSDQRSLLEARLTSGLTGAALVSLVTASSLGMKSLGQRAALPAESLAGKSFAGQDRLLSFLPESFRRGVLAPALKSDLINGSASGALAAAFAVQSDHLLRTGRPAQLSDTAAATYTGFMLGGAFGAYHQFRGRHESGRSNFDWSEASGQRQFQIQGGQKALNKALSDLDAGNAQLLRVREYEGVGTGFSALTGAVKLGPEKSLLLQHRSAGSAIDPRVAGADLLAACNLGSCFADKAVLPAATMYLRAGKDRISLSSQKPSELRNGEIAARALGRNEAGKTGEAAVAPDLMKAWTEHNLSLLKSLDKDFAQAAMQDGRMRLAVLDRDFLQSHPMRARDQIRPKTQRELGSADDYDPLLATQPVHIVKMSGLRGPEYHVLNGNNRVYLFGSKSSNPDNLGIPVWLYDSPKTFFDLYKYDVTSTAPKARPFIFD